MAETHYFTVTEGTYSRSNKDGSITTFMKGETVELEAPDPKAHNLVATPQGGRLPSPDGFLKKDPTPEVHTATAPGRGQKPAAADKAALTDRTVVRPATPSPVHIGSTDPHKVEKSSEKG